MACAVVDGNWFGVCNFGVVGTEERPMKNRKKGFVFFVIAVVCFVLALGLCGFNFYENYKAQKSSQIALQQIHQMIFFLLRYNEDKNNMESNLNILLHKVKR